MMKSKWLTARETATYLRVSERELLRWRKVEIFEASIHYLRKFPSANSALLYQIVLCETAMCDAVTRDVRTLEIAEFRGMDLQKLESHLGISFSPIKEETTQNLFEVKDIQISGLPVEDLRVRIKNEDGLKQLAYEIDNEN